MARRDRPEEDAKAAELAAPAPAPEAPISHVVVGAAAHDPLAHREQTGPSLLDHATWSAAKKLRPVDGAGFAAWARANALGPRSSDEWADAFVKFQQTPIK